MRIKIPDFRNGFSGSDLKHLKANGEKKKSKISGLELSKREYFPLTAGTRLCSTPVHIPASP